jgi:two-component system, chemotaxis family, response regulator Rcp1
MTGRETRPIEILLVEDNPGDVRLAIEAMREGNVVNHLSVVSDGEAAMAFLRRECGYTVAPRPDLILLDLNLPRKDGREVLAEIKSDPALRGIPVVVLTTSGSEEDILNAYSLHANCYINKPVDLDQFIRVLRSIRDFWFSVVRLPDGACATLQLQPKNSTALRTDAESRGGALHELGGAAKTPRLP